MNISGSKTAKQYIVESTGNGLAVFDYDRDGKQDILLVNADSFDQGGPDPRHYLYRNLGSFCFEDVTEAAGITHTGWAQGAWLVISTMTASMM